jgi:hypothetical protein
LFGDDAGNKPLGIKLDPYKTMFRMARMHVLIEKDKPFDRETLIEAIKAGRFFMGFDALGDTTGFTFTMGTATNTWGQGDVVEYYDGITLQAGVSGHYVAAFVVYCNGEAVYELSKEAYSNSFQIPVQKAGAYRVEVYRHWLGPPFDKMPWIISNPIYVK